ncbi:hypothetical protein GGR58DRAFT_521547 [Xylaria digitata]|nr:hypothetical protein GGR58DRAFT_521547 [Xylaria digitata]
MQKDLSAFLEFYRIERGILKGSDLSTPSQWRALQGTGSGGPSGNPTNPAPTRTNPAPRTGGGGGDDPDNSDSSDDSGEGNRRQPRNGNSDAGNIPGPDGRGETPQFSFTVGGIYKLKREDIGLFDPEYDDPNDVGVVTKGRNLIFTDVYSFSDRINSFFENDATRSSNKSQIMALLPTLLTESAVLW